MSLKDNENPMGMFDNVVDSLKQGKSGGFLYDDNDENDWRKFANFM